MIVKALSTFLILHDDGISYVITTRGELRKNTEISIAKIDPPHFKIGVVPLFGQKM